MTHNITINGTNRSGIIKRTEFEYAESAYLGETGSGRIVLGDAAGNIVVPGFKHIHANETDSTPSRIFTGFAHRKTIRRGVFAIGASREYEIATLDGNDLLRRRLIRGADGKRPKETVSQRTRWLVNQELSLVGVMDFGRIDSSSIRLDKSDTRGQYPADVLTAMSKAVSWNFYVRWNSDESEWEIVFRDDDAEADTCALAISNDLEDVDFETTFPPFDDADLSQDPEHIYSGAYATHAKGHVYEEDLDTADDFTRRDGMTEDSGTRLDSTASRDARRFLRNSDKEEQLLSVTIQVPSESVGLVQAGQRISTRMTHMEPEGWDPAVFPRILRLRRSQPTDVLELYTLRLELSSPFGSGGGGETVCGYELTEGQTIYPVGATLEALSENHTNPSDGIVYYERPGLFYPTVPTPGWNDMKWHFGLYGAGGTGTIDYAGDCVSNQLRFILVGPGTLTVQTEVYGGSPRPMAGSWGPSPGGYENSVGTFTSGDPIEFELSGECVNIVILTDGPGSPCGGKWGWSEAEWVPA